MKIPKRETWCGASLHGETYGCAGGALAQYRGMNTNPRQETVSRKNNNSKATRQAKPRGIPILLEHGECPNRLELPADLKAFQWEDFEGVIHYLRSL
jgi:hypothetical protein